MLSNLLELLFTSFYHLILFEVFLMTYSVKYWSALFGCESLKVCLVVILKLGKSVIVLIYFYFYLF